jgi:hypothetical protein
MSTSNWFICQSVKSTNGQLMRRTNLVTFQNHKD